MARRIHDDIVVPWLKWTGSEDDPYIDGFLDAEPELFDERAALVIEFVCDASPDDAVVALLLPWESCVVPDMSRLYDARSRRVVALAQRMLGVDRVGCTRFAISKNSQAVLAALDRARAIPPSEAPEPDTTGTPPAVHTLFVETRSSQPKDYSEMWSNYTRSIIALGEPIVEVESIFGGRDRPDIIATHLERTQLLIRPDVPPDKVLAELAPGGGLHKLFSRPLPLPIAE